MFVMSADSTKFNKFIIDARVNCNSNKKQKSCWVKY